MTGAAKHRAQQERKKHAGSGYAGSSSGDTSSSGKAMSDAHSVRSTQESAANSRRGGGDGNRDPEVRNPAKPQLMVTDLKNIDLGMAGWSALRGYEIPGTLPPRPKPSTLGTATKMGLNTFNVEKLPTSAIYQFDVLVGKGDEKRGLIRKVWDSEAFQKEFGHSAIFDGNKLAWSLKPIEREVKVMVDLDKEQGRTPRPGKEDANKHRIFIRQTSRVRMDVLIAYLEGKCAFDNACLEAINFLDHLLRESPSKRYTQIKRSFFARGEQRFHLGSAVEAFKGVYQSMRIAHGGPGQPARLTVNLDVANGTFWTEQPLHLACVQLTGRTDVPGLIAALRQGGDNSRAGQEIRKRMRKLHVVAKHRKQGNMKTVDDYVIERFIYQSARDHKFEKDGKMISVYDYFVKEHNVRLQFPDLPLVKMTKKGGPVLPMELLMIVQNQRYNFKMDERQTANMIKFAVTPPKERWDAITWGLKMLDWPNDPILKQFGLKINPAKQVVDARLLEAPKVTFGLGEAKPGTSGRWDLKGKKFLTPNTAPLKAWAVCVVPGRRGGKPDRAVVEHFVREFIKIYTTHGGRVENKQPAFTLASGDDVGEWVTAAWNAAGNQVQARPQILVFVLPDKEAITYNRIKRSAECRYGVVSQCMQYAHVQKAQAQYISNVCMKFNAKLGGATGRAVGKKSAGPTGLFTVPTLIIGADVSHAAPGSELPSMAALTVSMDKLGIRYAAACETNGHRVEMIATENINSILKPMIQSWVQNVGGGQFPKRIMYFRDGVSEGQYAHVLEQEVRDMKALLKTANPNLNIPFVVIVGSKRHHVRFFPDQGKGDRNGNPLPGTLVESGVTHPFENDFYLNSHAAIKGTARPMHYHVLLNEANMSNEDIQTLIYEHCYQYIRATTPVSQHPAIYYAHIASNRAVPHDPKWSESTEPSSKKDVARSGSQGGSQGRPGEGRSGGPSSLLPSEPDKLMTMPNQGNILTSMWYI